MSEVKIHPRLMNQGFNFVKINKGEKRCLEKRWNSRVYRYDSFGLKEHLEKGGNYGIQTNNSSFKVDGQDRHLLIVDFDSKEFQDKVINEFPKTFTTTSGSAKKCFHLWFLTDRLEKKFAITDKEDNVLADIFGEHGQVVAPGSLHPNGSVYSVVRDLPFSFLPYERLLEILKPYIKPKPKKEVKYTSNKTYGDNPFYDEVNSRLNVIGMLEHLGIDTSKNPTECPFHASVRGECLSFTPDYWKCHHGGCDKGGNLFTLVKEFYRLSAKQTFEKLAELTGLEDELKQQQIEYNRRSANGETLQN